MSSETKIVVLKMKELIYTLIFVALVAVLVIVGFLFLKGSKDEETAADASPYRAGVYTVSVALGESTANLKVAVDKDHINGISFETLSSAITTAYPLASPALEAVSAQIISSQSLENLSYDDDMKYTESYLVEMIEAALAKAANE